MLTGQVLCSSYIWHNLVKGQIKQRNESFFCIHLPFSHVLQSKERREQLIEITELAANNKEKTGVRDFGVVADMLTSIGPFYSRNEDTMCVLGGVPIVNNLLIVLFGF